jgi:hypothetical protein
MADSSGRPSRNPLDYEAPSARRLVTLCRMRVMEAELAKAKLAGHGIPCFLSERELVNYNPLIFSDVGVQVPECDEATAMQILSQPAPDDDEGEYVDEAWRCPNCHRKAVDLLPVSSFWRVIRYTCVALLVLLIFLPKMKSDYWDLVVGLVWVMALATLLVSAILVRRSKRCRECGHTWSKQPA